MRPLEGDEPVPLWLRALAGAFGAAGALHRSLHDRNRLKRSRLPVGVLSVGNLTVGGNGKTPAVEALARAALDAGKRPAILTRGYRGRRSGVLVGGCWVDGAAASAAESGDEPLLLSRALVTVPVVVGPDRTRGALELLERGVAVDFFVLDDGFQHRGLARELDLVLLDGARPLGNGRLLPAGPLREPAGALARADHLLVVVPDADAAIPEATHRLIADVAPRASFSRAWNVLGGLRPLHPNVPRDRRNPSAIAVSGIARPERFRTSLQRTGLEVAAWRPFPDHHRYRAGEVRALEAEAVQSGAILVTTAKDAVRLEGLAGAGAPWWVLDLELHAERGWTRFVEDALRARS